MNTNLRYHGVSSDAVDVMAASLLLTADSKEYIKMVVNCDETGHRHLKSDEGESSKYKCFPFLKLCLPLDTSRNSQLPENELALCKTKMMDPKNSLGHNSMDGSTIYQKALRSACLTLKMRSDLIIRF